MVIVHSIIGQLCLRGRCVGGIHDTYKRAHTMLPCVCKNWHCARVTRPQPARYRATRGPSIASPPLFPKNTTHRIPLPLSLSLSLSSFAITRHPCSRPLPCSATFVALRSPCHPLPDNVLRSPFPFFGFSFSFFFFGFLHLNSFWKGTAAAPTDWVPASWVAPIALF